MKRKESVYVAYIRYAEGVEDHACSAKSEKEAIKTICSLLYCTKEQIVKLEKYSGCQNPYEDPNFRRFVLTQCIDVPKEALEPFCPFEGMYCNCAYSASCLRCQEALEAYNKN